MRSRLFDADDEAGLELLHSILEELDLELGSPERMLGVSVSRVQVEDQVLVFYHDAWSMEVEGPKALVEMILGYYREQALDE